MCSINVNPGTSRNAAPANTYVSVLPIRRSSLATAKIQAEEGNALSESSRNIRRSTDRISRKRLNVYGQTYDLLWPKKRFVHSNGDYVHGFDQYATTILVVHAACTVYFLAHPGGDFVLYTTAAVALGSTW